VIVRRLGLVEYEPTWRAMQAFTAARTADTPDEIWLCEHPPVFTLGLAGKPEHLLRDIGVPVVKIDRGGQITYHGPGQLVAYLLLDLKRHNLTVKGLVQRMEQAMIELLADCGVGAARLAGAPGVYVPTARSEGGPAAGGGVAPASGMGPPEFGAKAGEKAAPAGGLAKIGALGLKVKNGCCYHGLALNVAMDLAPFAAINPCGYEGMAVTQLAAFVPDITLERAAAALVEQLEKNL
jgi:lipoyl(octanoyl) transferase